MKQMHLWTVLIVVLMNITLQTQLITFEQAQQMGASPHTRLRLHRNLEDALADTHPTQYNSYRGVGIHDTREREAEQFALRMNYKIEVACNNSDGQTAFVVDLRDARTCLSRLAHAGYQVRYALWNSLLTLYLEHNEERALITLELCENPRSEVDGCHVEAAFASARPFDAKFWYDWTEDNLRNYRTSLENSRPAPPS